MWEFVGHDEPFNWPKIWLLILPSSCYRFFAKQKNFHSRDDLNFPIKKIWNFGNTENLEATSQSLLTFKLTLW